MNEKFILGIAAAGILGAAVLYTTINSSLESSRQVLFRGSKLEVITENVIGGLFSGNEKFIYLNGERCFSMANGKPVKEYLAGLKDKGVGTHYARFDGNECAYLERKK